AKDGIDFSALAHRINPSAGATASYSFKAGPFIVPRTYAGLAKPLITAFGNNVAVYQLDEDVVVDVHYEVHFRPHIFVANTNSNVHTNVLVEAGIPAANYVVSADYTILGPQCFTIATEPHQQSASNVPGIRAFISGGGNFFAQCLSIDTYENHATDGHMVTTAGIVRN